MEPSDAKRLRALEDENSKLKTSLAELMLDNAMRRALNPKNGNARWKAAGCGAVERLGAECGIHRYCGSHGRDDY